MDELGLTVYSFPRSRGDEPVSDFKAQMAQAFSPLTRG